MTVNNQKNDMIPISAPQWQSPDWKKSFADVITDPKILLQLLSLPMELLPAAIKAAKLFPLRVPRELISRMRVSDPNDPLLLQVLPLHAESIIDPEYSFDPVGDQFATATPGLLHKYHGRVLLLPTGACAVHCRYCFRRHFPYTENIGLGSQWPLIDQYIRADESISEVILSGGDPLSLSDEKILDTVERLASIEHLQRIRIHTRLPIMIPSRITVTLLNGLSQTRLDVVMVMHVNHANEIDKNVILACKQLRKHNVHLLNQSVLLRNINDSVKQLVDLSESLFTAGVLPYYLHLLDKVQAAAHFEVTEQQANILWTQLNSQLPGYLVPRLVKEVSQAPAKQPLQPDLSANVIKN